MQHHVAPAAAHPRNECHKTFDFFASSMTVGAAINGCNVTLLEEHLNLAHWAVGQFPGLDHHEALSAALDVLWKCAETYDPSLGVPFPKFAIKKLKWQMLSLLRTKNQTRSKHSTAHLMKPGIFIL